MTDFVFPTPQLFTADAAPPLRWGIVGTGWIATRFVHALRAHTRQSISAVASRTIEGARRFADEQAIETVAVDAVELAARSDVDVVYISTPQSRHVEDALQVIGAGTPVLVEKPLATSAEDARRLIDAAARAGVFVAEGMWTRYLPHTAVLRALLEDGALGDVRLMTADIGQAVPEGHRIRRADLGGGAALDLGVYPLALSSSVFGAPTAVSATGEMTATGVDGYAAIALAHGPGRHTGITTTIEVHTPAVASIHGTSGRVQLGGNTPFHIPGDLVYWRPGYFTEPQVWTDTTGVERFDGLAWEINAMARFIGEGRLESPLHTSTETVQIIQTIDDVRRLIKEGA
jgi:predicted dehydrogenase